MAYDLEAKATATSSSDHHVRREKISSGASATASRISKKKKKSRRRRKGRKGLEEYITNYGRLLKMQSTINFIGVNAG